MNSELKFSLGVIAAIAASFPVLANSPADIPNKDPGFAQQDTRMDADQRDQEGFEAKANRAALDARDREEASMLPLDQGNLLENTDSTAEIRRDIMARGGMSAGAQNVRIIAQDGQIRLRGFVRTKEEKNVVAEIARKRFRPVFVDDQLKVFDDSQRNQGVNTVGTR